MIFFQHKFEKKGILEKIKDKLPGHHNHNHPWTPIICRLCYMNKSSARISLGLMKNQYIFLVKFTKF